MGNIVLLDDLTINKIAAGEVIERPASVVKEMVENSIDAGASNINIEIKNGGISLIKITDDGCGISVDDMEIAFERHATSKIRSASDLATVTTMGFRGEALASIAAIANVEMISKKQGEDIGHRIVVEGGKILEKTEIGCPVGTTITVKNLFFNTPVRYKFLKKDFTEAGFIEDTVKRMALVNKFVSLKLISNGKTVISTNGSGDFKNIVYSIYGKDIANGIMEVNNELEGINVSGVVGKPEIARANRQNQIFFVNGRYIKDKNLTAAVDQAYKGIIPIGKYGFVILNIEINPQLLDVNVHPAKLEVRFQDENAVFKAVYHAIKIGISNGELVANINEPIMIDKKPDVVIEEPISSKFENHEENNVKVEIKEGMSIEERIEKINSVINQISNMSFESNKTEKNNNNDNTSKNNNFQVFDSKDNEYPKSEHNLIEEIYNQRNNITNNEEEIYDKRNNFTDNEKAEDVVVKDVAIENKFKNFNSYEEEGKTIEFGNVRISSNTQEIDTNLINQKLKESNYNSKINEETAEFKTENKTQQQSDKKEEFISAITNKILEAKLNDEESTEMIDSNRVKNVIKNIPDEITPEFEEMYKKAFGIDLKQNKKPEESANKELQNDVSKLEFENADNHSLFEKTDSLTPINYKFVGVAFSTYIIIEINDELYMIDQHAAHERIMYEKIRANYYSNDERESQLLLIPDVITLTNKEIDIAKENSEMFNKAGFEFEEFGPNTIKLTSVPSMCEDMNTKTLFIELLDEIDTVAVTATQEKEDKFIATVACKAAVKGNMNLNIQEVNALMKDLLALPNPFSCPHGRPTSVKMTKYDIERKFSRK